MSKLPKSHDPIPTLTRTIKRSHIWLLYALGQTPEEIYKNLQRAYGSDCPCFSTVRNWCRRFKTGNLSFEDEYRSGRPSDNLFELKGDTIERLVKENPFVTLEEIAQEVKSSPSAAENVLRDHLLYRSYTSC